MENANKGDLLLKLHPQMDYILSMNFSEPYSYKVIPDGENRILTHEGGDDPIFVHSASGYSEVFEIYAEPKNDGEIGRLFTIRPDGSSKVKPLYL